MNKETIKAVVNTIVVVVVTILSALGINVDGDMLVNVLCAVVLIGATIYGCYKNHNFTEAAQEGQLLIDEIKANKWRETLLGNKASADTTVKAESEAVKE